MINFLQLSRFFTVIRRSPADILVTAFMSYIKRQSGSSPFTKLYWGIHERCLGNVVTCKACCFTYDPEDGSTILLGTQALDTSQSLGVNYVAQCMRVIHLIGI